jgi:ABC-2 type transport system permease protein
VIALNNIFALVHKEWRHYFGSPIAYVALFVWTLLFGGFFSLRLGFFLESSMQGPRMGAAGLSLNEWLIAPVLYNMAVVALFLTPMLTMRLFAEEKRQGTIELLSTAPLTDLQIVLGKFFGAVALYALMIGVGFLNFLVLWRWAITAPDWRPVATGALGLLLLGGAFIALGLCISTLTRNQIVAGTLTFGLLLGIWILGWLDSPSSGSVLQVLTYLGLVRHIEDLMKGVLDLKDVVYYLSFIVFFLFLAHQSVESQRWRA